MRRKSRLAALAALAGLAALALGAGRAAAAPQDRYAANDGVRIHYVVAGKGPLVVMIHGFPDYWATWKPLMGVLQSAGYRTAALDGRGYNLSDKPEGVDTLPQIEHAVIFTIASRSDSNFGSSMPSQRMSRAPWYLRAFMSSFPCSWFCYSDSPPSTMSVWPVT
jgi:pimeloyl-ACP methyl ester carboxylesterase